MLNISLKNQLSLILIIICLFFCTMSGCSVVGPASISQGRLSYAEVINRTEDEQMLLAIVRGRYGETFTLLAVNTVTANMRFISNIGANVGLGNEQDYTGALVPLSGGVAFEENPTITYTPIQGEEYIRQFMSPVPLSTMMMMLRSDIYCDQLLRVLLNRVNNLQSPCFLGISSQEPNREFERFIELFSELQMSGALELARSSREDKLFDLLINTDTPGDLKKINEFLELLDLPISVDKSSTIVIPVSTAVRKEGSQCIRMTTRSPFEMLEIMRASVEVPREHAEAGLTQEYPPIGLPGQGIRILSSRTRPDTASLAVKHRGHWFYIDETDQTTKRTFFLLRRIWSIIMTSCFYQSSAPDLTIPVSR